MGQKLYINIKETRGNLQCRNILPLSYYSHYTNCTKLIYKCNNYYKIEVCIYQPLCTRSIFKLSLTGLNSKFSFSYTGCQTKTREASLSYYLHIAGGRIIEFIPFIRILVLCEMESASSRI